MTDLINWTIEESIWDTVINMNNIITTQRRFPPYLQKPTKIRKKGNRIADIKIYNRTLTEDEMFGVN